MAFTRKMLKALGIDEDKIDQIVDAHTEVVDALKEQRDKYKTDAETLPSVQKELDELKNKPDDGFKEKFENMKKEYAEFKARVEGEQIAAAKEAAARALFENKGIKGKNLDLALLAAKEEISNAELDGDKFKDAKSLESFVADKLSALIGQEKTTGANPANPPSTVSGTITSRADIYKRDERGRYLLNTEERQKALVEMMNNERK